MNWWLVISLLVMVYGYVVASVRSTRYWSAWGYPETQPDAWGVLAFVAGLVSVIFWAVAAIAIRVHGGQE